jgi:hypothetical protein
LSLLIFCFTSKVVRTSLLCVMTFPEIAWNEFERNWKEAIYIIDGLTKNTTAVGFSSKCCF